jgi:serine/threonine protein phosphatase PrpC
MSTPTVLPGHGLRGTSAGATDTGHVRDHNEDALLADDRRGLWVVADGMGGHAGGAEASASVVTCVNHVRTTWTTAKALAQDVISRLEDAHEAIRARSRANGGGTAGTTVVCLVAFDRHGLVAWCGDSRLYRLRAGAPLEQISRDHTMVQTLVDHGQLAAEDAEAHPQAHVLTRAVGATPELQLDYQQLTLLPGDRFLLCSDGLTRPVPEMQIAQILREATVAQVACDRLLAQALAQGAPDNVTVVVIDFT